MRRRSGMLFHLQGRTCFLLERECQLSNMINRLLVSRVTSSLVQEDHERFPSFPEVHLGTRTMRMMKNSSMGREGVSNHWGLSQIDQHLEAEDEEEDEEEEEEEEVAEEEEEEGEEEEEEEEGEEEEVEEEVRVVAEVTEAEAVGNVL